MVGVQKFLKKAASNFLLKADGCSQYLLVAAESCFGSRGRYQGEAVTSKDFVEKSQICLGKMDKEQAGVYAVELPIMVQHFSVEYDLVVVVDILDEHDGHHC